MEGLLDQGYEKIRLIRSLKKFHIVKMNKDKEVRNVKDIFFVNVWRKNIFDIYVTEYCTALTTIFWLNRFWTLQ
jgi:predicted glycosyltransferase